MTRVICPCCKGAKRLAVIERATIGTCTLWPGCGCGTQSGPHTCEGQHVTWYDCCHCQGRGWVPAEIEETEQRAWSESALLRRNSL